MPAPHLWDLRDPPTRTNLSFASATGRSANGGLRANIPPPGTACNAAVLVLACATGINSLTTNACAAGSINQATSAIRKQVSRLAISLSIPSHSRSCFHDRHHNVLDRTMLHTGATTGSRRNKGGQSIAITQPNTEDRPNKRLQLTALRRARSALFCVLESTTTRISLALAKAARRQLNRRALGRIVQPYQTECR